LRFGDIECLLHNDVVFVAGGSSRGRGKLSLRDGFTLFHYHPTEFGPGILPAGREAHQPEPDDILRSNTNLKVLEGERDPWIQHKCENLFGVRRIWLLLKYQLEKSVSEKA
jgi:hypothetical protein